MTHLQNSNTKFHGLVLVDKPVGLTSHDVVARLRKALATKEIGHTGTLDPMASGLMVILVNEATKLSRYILERDKEYIAGFRLGLETDTLDVTGQTLRQSESLPQAAAIEKAIVELQGSFQWPVPLFSAAKVDGKRLHEYAREGQAVEPPVKEMNFQVKQHELSLEGEHHGVVGLRVSKGSFVRSWISELGKKLGCGAAMSSLRRTVSEPYSLEQAVTLDYIESNRQDVLTSTAAIPLSACLPHWKVIRVQGQDLNLIRNGAISNSLRQHLISIYRPGQDEGVKILSSQSGELLALVGLEEGRGFRVLRGFQISG